MAQDWYYLLDGEQRGPVSAAELKQLATAGKLKPDDKVKKEGMAGWVAASQVKGLFGASPVPAATARQADPPPTPPDRGDVNKVAERTNPSPGGGRPPKRSAPSQPASRPEPLPLPDEDEEGGEPAPVRGRSRQERQRPALWATAMTTWRQSSTPMKAGIVGGMGVVLFLLVLVPVLLSSGGKASFGDGGTSSPSRTGDGSISAGDTSRSAPGLEPEEFAERLRKLTGARKFQPNSLDGNQAANMFERPQPFSPKWKKMGPFTLYAIQSNNKFRAGDAIQAVGKPDRVLQAPWLSTFQNPPGKEWQEWVWVQNGKVFRCWVTNVSALKEQREELEVKADDEVGIASPGLLIGSDSDF